MRAAHCLAWLTCLQLLVLPTAQSRPAVVELFTSQGCSSCPPAEALLGQLGRRPDVVALAFHVDYWDGLGWTDRFGLHEALLRQSRYAETFGLPSVYTPQIVIDGNSDFVGTDQRPILSALAAARTGVAVHLSVVGNDLVIDVGEQPGALPSDIILAAVLPQAVTTVPRGENAGHTLTEYNIVRTLRVLGTWQGQSSRRTVPLSSFPTDATRVALLIQQSGQGPVVGAAVAELK
jgi:hypothetical protein